jgi:hypothetical protein
MGARRRYSAQRHRTKVLGIDLEAAMQVIAHKNRAGAGDSHLIPRLSGDGATLNNNYPTEGRISETFRAPDASGKSTRAV